MGGHNKYTIEYIKTEINKIGYTCLSAEYINNRSKSLVIKCNSGHEYITSWTVFKNRKGCPICRSTFCGVDNKGVKRAYRDRNWLYNKYINELMSSKVIAKYCGVGHRLILS